MWLVDSFEKEIDCRKFCFQIDEQNIQNKQDNKTNPQSSLLKKRENNTETRKQNCMPSKS